MHSSIFHLNTVLLLFKKRFLINFLSKKQIEIPKYAESMQLILFIKIIVKLCTE